MNRSDYFQKISELYELSDKLKIVNTSQKIDLFILNLSPLLRFALFIYFLILRLFPSSLHSEKIIKLLQRVWGLKLFHQLCVNIFLIIYYDEA